MSIENARAWLAGAFHREFKEYIETKLAGDFACVLVELFERKDAQIAELGEQLKTSDSACFIGIIENKALRAELAALKAQGVHIPTAGDVNAMITAQLAAPVPEANPQTEAFKPEELRIDTYHAGEHSGFLHTNETAVRITHLPTGAYVESKDERSVHRNKQKCLDMLPAAIEAKARGVVMPERWNVPRPMWKDARQPYGNPLNHADIEAAEKFNLALDEVARLNAAPVSDAKAQGEYGDAYQGAREDLAIWKRRALEAEEKVLQQEQIIDHLTSEAQGESRFGEPVVTPDAPCVPDGYVLADKKALGTVLQALVNAPHHIRELQVTRQPVELFSDNPINVLIANYEAPAAPASPAADAGLVAVEWAKDADGWGPALNEAGWLFLSELNEDPQKSALIFNSTKGPLRAAIMKYAGIVAANAKDSSHD